MQNGRNVMLDKRQYSKWRQDNKFNESWMRALVPWVEFSVTEKSVNLIALSGITCEAQPTDDKITRN